MRILFAMAVVLMLLCGSVYGPCLAQISSPAKNLNIYAYPRSGQNADKQLKDENECYASAKQQTGVDPTAPPPATKSAEPKAAEQKAAADAAKAPVGGRVKGAAGGAAGGAAIGAIAGDAGQGAAIGAVAGTVVGGAKQRRAKRQAKEQAAASTAAAQQNEEAAIKQEYAAKIGTFKRAFSACLDARGYSVK